MQHFLWMAAAFQAGPEPERQIQPASVHLFLKKYFLMVDVHALIGLAVDIEHGFEAGIVACPGHAEIEHPYGTPPGPFRRDLCVQMKP